MLTKEDLDQIRKIVREEVEAESRRIRKDLSLEIKLLKMELSNRIDDLEKRVGNIEKDALLFKNFTEKHFKKIHKELAVIKKGVEDTISYFDREDGRIKSRLDKIEKALQIS